MIFVVVRWKDHGQPIYIPCKHPKQHPSDQKELQLFGFRLEPDDNFCTVTCSVKRSRSHPRPDAAYPDGHTASAGSEALEKGKIKNSESRKMTAVGPNDRWILDCSISRP